MIFNLYPVVRVKLGGESYDFDRESLMFTEVVEVEDATGLSFGEWQAELGRYSIRAVAGLLHILRKRAGVPSDFQTLNFAAADLDVVPLHDDGTEFTAAEVAADITRRVEEAKNPPTGAGKNPEGTASTSLTSPPISASVPGNGSTSRGVTSGSSSGPLTPT